MSFDVPASVLNPGQYEPAFQAVPVGVSPQHPSYSCFSVRKR